MVPSHPKSIGILRVDRLSTGPLDLGCHNIGLVPLDGIIIAQQMQEQTKINKVIFIYNTQQVEKRIFSLILYFYQ